MLQFDLTVEINSRPGLGLSHVGLRGFVFHGRCVNQSPIRCHVPKEGG